ncbi:MAG TPA: acyl-CoA dehydratase activase [Candidatus Methanoperedens sp.]|nr:acyl-CoA dehydratase activase [Candidatus Methanoperedens sp.]
MNRTRNQVTALAVGVDAGSVSVNCAVVDAAGAIVHEEPYRRHFGRPAHAVREALAAVRDRFGAQALRSVTFTGSHGQEIAARLEAPWEPETVAQIIGAAHVAPGVRTILAIGGQDAALFALAWEGGNWRLEHFAMNGPCASGTGSFIDQQAERLAATLIAPAAQADQGRLEAVLAAFIREGLASERPAPVACRCTVFTKSDMIHLQNKGEPLANIVAGLHDGNAANFVSTIVGTRALQPPVIFIGGVAANPLQVRAFRRHFPELAVPAHHASLGAAGAALISQRAGRAAAVDPARLDAVGAARAAEVPRVTPLALALTRFEPSDGELPPPAVAALDGGAWLGVDIGSTTTKFALLDGSGRIVAKRYVPTRGRPIEVARELVTGLRGQLGPAVRLLGVATTGSGRQVVGDFLAADLVIDEITAHARGAVEADPTVDTIFEIGGQDAKYISLDGRHARDFDMNKVCAAGTGSFLHELAAKLGVDIVGEFERTALASLRPVQLAERCTVFMESDLVSAMQRGVPREDLIGGLAYAVVRNYLNRVVGKRAVGKRVMFLGGPSLNRSVVAAFERVLGRGVVVPAHREVMGARGAALAARDAAARGEIAPALRTLGEIGTADAAFRERICRADPACRNECKLRVYDFGGRASVWGGECGRYEASRRGAGAREDLFAERARRFVEALDGKAELLAPRAPAPERVPAGTIGLPLALHGLGWGVFWTHLLAGLGWRVVLSPPTDERISRAGVESMTAETCYPVKVFHGHVRHLLARAERLFLPNVISLPSPGAGEHGMLCPYVESSQFMVSAALALDPGRLVKPTLFLAEGPEAAARDLRRALPPERRPALRRLTTIVRDAWERQEAFSRSLERRGEEILAALPPDEPVWVVSGRPYNLYDERCNLRIGRQLAALGVTALPLDFLALNGEDLSDFPNMYWGLGARVLRAARRVTRTPNLFGVHLTNFGCGPDSFLEHFYRHATAGKPALVLELDEHSAVAGVVTRLEAYRNVVRCHLADAGVGATAPQLALVRP